MSRLLTRRSHIRIRSISLLAGALAATGLACSAAAVAAPPPRDAVSPAGPAGPALSEAREAPIASLRRPVVRFHAAIHASASKRRAERQARRRQRRQRFAELPGGVSRETLEAIAACESGGDPAVVSADGSYRGKYQFDFGTWESVGGSGDPAAAPEPEQDYRAALLYVRSGSSPWPVCG